MERPIISLAETRFRWAPDEPDILDIPELEVAAGERISIHGASGSGKTTLLNLLGAMARPQAGRIEVLGTDLSALSSAGRDDFRARHVGFIFQLFNLVPYLGLVENVTLPCRFSAERRARAEARSGTLAAEAERLLAHMRLDTRRLARRPVANLSVGQQQRVAAARALIGAPEIVIADEPTSSVDADASRAFMGLLFEEVAASGATLVFVTHDRRLDDLFDRTLDLARINRAPEAA